MTNESTQDKEPQQNPIVNVEMENGKMIKLELYPSIAPETVKNFVALVSQGFYDGLIFHRVIPGFMIQGGDPDGTGMGGSKQTVRGEFSGNGFKNDLKHDRGVISMARTSAPNSASSQFFIVVKASSFLDGQYAAFGKVTEGMEEVDRIVSVPKTGGDKPLEDQKMKKVTIQL
ncbi:MAG TPA: peptidylprolyl isomerase [Desulfosporosinus sp.]|nr:peptidylprolyl isomerase [Desulfosporosinus sp.]